MTLPSFVQPFAAKFYDAGGAVFNVKHPAYGAKGDGVTDDTAAIQAALNAVGAYGGGTVFLPAGTYVCSATISWPVASKVALLGDGPKHTLLVFPYLGAFVPCVLVGQPHGATLSGVAIRNLAIAGAANNNTAPDYGITFVDNVNDVTVEGCEFYYLRMGGVRGSYNSGTAGARYRVANSYFHDIQTSLMSPTAGGAIQVAALAGDWAVDWEIADNVFVNCGNTDPTSHSIYVYGMKGLTVRGNRVSGQYGNFQIGGPVQDYAVIGNILRGVNTSYFYGGGVVAGNVFEAYGSTDAARIYTTGSVVFSGNRVQRSTHGYGVSVLNAAGDVAVISSNVFVDTDSAAGSGVSFAVYYAGAGDGAIISENRVDGFSGAIGIYQGNSHQIRNNRLRTLGIGGAAIYFSNSSHTPSGSVIAGNIIACDGGQHSITDAVLGQNTWYSNVLLSGAAPANVIQTFTQGGVQSLVYGASVAVDASKGGYKALTVTDGNAFTIANPTGGSSGQLLTIRIYNNSGGPLGAITWGANFALAGAFVSPANGSSRLIQFIYDDTKWREVSRTAADE